MSYLAAALHASDRETVEAFSALPDAPVVVHVEPVAPVRRTRTVAAALLYRLGDVMAPPRSVHGSRT